jgi:hypothetical protein
VSKTGSGGREMDMTHCTAEMLIGSLSLKLTSATRATIPAQ